MKRWGLFTLGAIWSAQSLAFLGDMDFLYLPSEFVAQRTEYCRLYFPEQLARYDAGQKKWLDRNGKNENALQKTLRNYGCNTGKCKDAEGVATTEEQRTEILVKRARASLKKDMLNLAKADEKKAVELCKETLDIIEGDTLDLADLTEVFQKDRK